MNRSRPGSWSFLGRAVGLLCLCLWLGLGCARPGQPEALELELWTISLKPKFTDYMDGVLVAFEKQHPGLKVTWVDLPQRSILQKFMSAIAGGVPPDVVNVTTGNAIMLAQHEALVKLSGRVPVAVEQEYYPNLWQANAWQGEVYAFPWYASTRVLLYNRALLASCGLRINRPIQSWDEVASIAQAVHAHSSAYGFEPVIRLLEDLSMAGVETYDEVTHQATFTTPEACERLDWYSRLYQRGEIPADCLIEGPQGALERYKQGSLALLEAGPQQLLKIKADAPSIYQTTGVSPLPLSPTGTIPAALMNLVVPRASRHQALALELAAWITNAANQLQFAKVVPLLPSTWRSAQDRFFTVGKGEPLQDEAIRISLKQLPRARDFSLKLAHSKELEKTMNDAVENCLYGQASAQAALQQAAKEWNQIVQADQPQGQNNE